MKIDYTKEELQTMLNWIDDILLNTEYKSHEHQVASDIRDKINLVLSKNNEEDSCEPKEGGSVEPDLKTILEDSMLMTGVRLFPITMSKALSHMKFFSEGRIISLESADDDNYCFVCNKTSYKYHHYNYLDEFTSNGGNMNCCILGDDKSEWFIIYDKEEGWEVYDCWFAPIRG